MQSDSGHPGDSLAARLHSGIAAVPLFHATCLFAAGILIARAAWIRPFPLLLALTALLALAFFAVLRTPRIAWISLATLWVLLGTWCAEMQPQPSPAPQLLSLSDGLLRSAEGTVLSAGPLREEPVLDEQSAWTEISQTIDVGVQSLEVVSDTEDRQSAIAGNVRLTLRWPEGADHPQRVTCGERIRVLGRLRPPQVYRDPGAWSRREYLLDQGITATSTVDARSIEHLGSGGASLRCSLSEAQRSAGARLLTLPDRTKSLPGWLRISRDDAVMLTAMVTGDRTFLSHDLRVGFERTGSFHMLVVSGLHLAIVAGFVLALFRKLRIPRIPATLLTIFASFAYALFTGFAPPVQRSLWMVSVYLIGRLVYRDRNALNTIGFAGLCLLVASPRSLFETSFQMTLLAVVAIGGIAAPLLQRSLYPYLNATLNLRRVAMDVKLDPVLAQFRVVLRMIAARLHVLTSRWFAWKVFPACVRGALRVAEALVVTIVVELAMTLPMAADFHRLTLVALPVNLFILPLLVLMLPAALLTMLVLLLWPAAAFVPAAVTAFLLHIGVGLVRLFGGMQWSDIRLSAPNLLQVAVFIVLLACAMLLAHSAAPWRRRMAWAALLLAGVVAVVPRPVQHPHDALLVEALDVGQGDSILLITPGGKTLLIDGGGFGGGPRQVLQNFDIGEEVVSAALWARGIRHLDVVALSHAHEDHIGGLPAVLRNFHPDELWVGMNPPSAVYNALLDQAAQQHMTVRHLTAGDQLSLESAQVNVLAPFADYRPGAEASNNDSLVLHVAFKGSSVLLEGDAEELIEQRMLGEPGLQSQLLKVGHHGSTTSTDPEFLKRVAPRWAVISCGLHNRYGHPRSEILNELESAGVRTSSTDAEGAVCFQLDGSAVQREDSCGTDGHQ